MPAEELDARKAAILRAVVTEYIGTALPVGSSTVASAARLEVSSATIRAEMVALEREGYLHQPHTSAGRVPTDKGYRFFVDHLTGDAELGPAKRRAVEEFFETARGETEAVLERASGLLSDLTRNTAVVVGPAHDAATVRSVQVVELAPGTLLTLVVLSDGSVEKRTVDLNANTDRCAAASRLLSDAMVGRTLAAAPTPTRSGDADLDALVAACTSAMADLAQEASQERMFVGGNARLAEAFEAVEVVRDVLGILEQQLVVINLLRDVVGRGLSVAIGEEHGFAPLATCAVVVAPVTVEGEARGLVGLLGPTRMNYAESLAAAEVVGRRLGQRLEHHRSDDDA